MSDIDPKQAMGEANMNQLDPRKGLVHEVIKRSIPAKCHMCGHEFWISISLKQFIDKNRNGKVSCHACLKKGKDEIRQAQINLAKRKAQMKAKK